MHKLTVLFPCTAVNNCHRCSGLNNGNVLSHSSGAQKSKIKMSAEQLGNWSNFDLGPYRIFTRVGMHFVKKIIFFVHNLGSMIDGLLIIWPFLALAWMNKLRIIHKHIPLPFLVHHGFVNIRKSHRLSGRNSGFFYDFIL